MIFWMTQFLVAAFFLVEIYLLAVKRCRDSKHQSDRGSLRLVWILITGGCVVGFLLAPKVSFLGWPDSSAIVLLADLLLTAGIALRIWSIVHLGRFFTVNVAIQEGQRVIQDGPYRFVRHPSYSGSMLALVGLACLTFNWLGFAVITGCSFLAYTLRISVEEKVLLKSLGEEYRQYAERTKRLVPGIY
jgi:protein-S-isoprenylcysteine O-methyltransferase Ste14